MLGSGWPPTTWEGRDGPTYSLELVAYIKAWRAKIGSFAGYFYSLQYDVCLPPEPWYFLESLLYINCWGGRLVRSLVFALGQGCGGGVGIFREQVAVVFFGFRRRLRF